MKEQMRSDKTRGRSAVKYREKAAGCYIAAAVLVILAAALLASARYISGFAEWYSIMVYPLLVASVGRLSGLLPFSLAEAVCVALPFILVAAIIRHRRHVGVFFRRLLLFIAILLFLYAANCGVNYYRDPFVSQDVYSDASFTADQLAGFCEYAAAQLAESSEAAASMADSGESFLYPEGRELAETAVEAMAALGGRSDGLSGYYPRPKKLTVLSGLFSKMGVSGIYSPFTIEANINGEMPGMEQPFTACHELSHLRGYMNEGEANYIGWLACVGSDDPAFRRSGWLIAWSYAGSSLYRTDPERYEEILKKLPQDALRELIENHEFWDSHETKASEIQDRVNDAYLKSSGQADGIASYGRLTTLMLIWYYSDR